MASGNEELAETIRDAAVTLLHREILRHGQVTLTQEDFADAALAEAMQQAIQLNVGPNDSVIFTHAKQDQGRSVS